MLYFHQHKILILGFISRAKSIITISKELFDRNENPFKYVCTSIQILAGSHSYFSNPNVIQIRTAIKKTLLRNSILSSNKANVLVFEAGTQSLICSLPIKSKQTPIANLISNNLKATDFIVHRNFEELFDSIVHTKVTDNILFYISDYITLVIL